MTVDGAANTAAETAGNAVKETILTVTELVDNTNMMYIVAALGIGLVIGIGVVLMMDDANQKNAERIAENVQNVYDDSQAPVEL